MYLKKPLRQALLRSISQRVLAIEAISEDCGSLQILTFIPHGENVLTYTIKELHDGWTDERTLEIPDGKWVLEICASTVNHYYDDGTCDPESETRRNQTVGPKPESYTLNHDKWRNAGVNGWTTTSLLVGDAPFGAVTTDTQEGDGLYFTSAQQVSKGELGRRIPIIRPGIVHSASRTGNRGQRRTKQSGWVLLSKLAELAKLPPLEVVQCYFAFTDQRKPQLHLVQGDVARVKSRERDGHSYERIHACELTSDRWASLDLEQTWVRLDWATRVLQMRALNYVPANTFSLPLAA